MKKEERRKVVRWMTNAGISRCIGPARSSPQGNLTNKQNQFKGGFFGLVFFFLMDHHLWLARFGNGWSASKLKSKKQERNRGNSGMRGVVF